MTTKLARTRTLVAAFVLAAAGIVWLLWGAVPGRLRQQEESPRTARPVKTMVVGTPATTGERVFPGRIAASQKVNLSFRVSGQVIELPVVKGEYIEPGTLLARIDPRDFEVQLENAKSELGNARARLEAMRAGARPEEIAMLTSKVNSARAQMSDAAVTLERVEKLYKAGGFSRAEFDKAKTAHEVARAAYQSASQELSAARSGARTEDIAAMEFTIRGIESRVRAAENALADTELRAPFGGVVIDRYVDNNQSVQRDQPIVSLQDIGTLEVVISVPETLVLHARRDEILGTISARFSSMPERRFPLIYKEASAQADPQTQTYPVTFSLPTPDDLTVLPGMTVDVLVPRILEGLGDGGVELPAAAVFAGEGTRHFVWRVEGTDALTIRRVPVEIVGYREDMAEIRGGVAPGDRIVTAGVSFLQEGDPVTLYSPPGN